MAIERVPSGIPGLDKILEGGFPRTSSTLISGTPGTAKTLFGLQYIVNGALDHGEPGIFVSVEDPEETLNMWFGRLGWDFGDLKKKGLVLVHTPDIKTEEGEDFVQYITNDNFLKIIRTFKAKRIVFDSLTTILEFSEGFGGYRRGTQTLIKLYRSLGLTTLFTHERKVPLERLDFDMEQFVIDGTIFLDMIKVADHYEKCVSVLKMRGTNHGRGIYPFQIRKKGIVVFPEQHIM